MDIGSSNKLSKEIKEAIKKFDDDELDIIPENTTREFEIGQDVLVGHLKECRIEHISKDARLVVFSHALKGEKRGTAFDNGRALMASSWIDIYPNAEQIDRFGQSHPVHNLLSGDISSIIHSVYHRGIITNPDYQRDYVWTESDKVELVHSIFNGYDIGKFIFINHPYPENRLEVLDGKQRLSAITEFIEGKFQYKEFFFHELSRMDQRSFKSLRTQTIELNGERITKKEILKLFLSVNHAGVPQTAEHIEKVQKMYDKLTGDK